MIVNNFRIGLGLGLLLILAIEVFVDLFEHCLDVFLCFGSVHVILVVLLVVVVRRIAVQIILVRFDFLGCSAPLIDLPPFSFFISVVQTAILL